MAGILPFVVEPPINTGSYKHMAKRDAAIWERWLDKYGGALQGVAYDVALGGQLPPDESASDEDRRMWQYATALKIDAVAFRAEHVLIIEVKPWAHSSAIGAALTYKAVADREGLTTLPTYAAIVCEGIQADVAWYAEQLGILVWTV